MKSSTLSNLKSLYPELDIKSHLYPSYPSYKDTFRSLIYLPKKFAVKFRAHIWILLPLIVTQLLQKSQDLVDDRFVAFLGTDALAIHNVLYSLFLIGQEIGLAAATSALIFWKRKEVEGKQGLVLRLHLAMPVLLTSFASLIIYFYLGSIIAYFKVPESHFYLAKMYLTYGLVNLVVRSAYVPLTAMLIACDQRMKCTILAGCMLAAKVFLGWSVIYWFWDQNLSVGSIRAPMQVIGCFAIAVLVIAVLVSTYWVSRLVDGWKKIDLRSVFNVWPGELGIVLVNTTSSLIFGLQIARANASSSLFVTFQLASHFCYILSLPVLAGMQIAIKDASSEQSHVSNSSRREPCPADLGGDEIVTEFKPLSESAWWPQFFYASYVPTTLLLWLTAAFCKPFFYYIYHYDIPSDHLIFLRVFFLGWSLWQSGNIFLVMLRASKKNGLATRNYMLSTFFVQVGLTQLALSVGWATPLTVGLITFASCFTYLVMNIRSVSEIQSKYYLFKYRQAGFKFPRITSKAISKQLKKVSQPVV